MEKTHSASITSAFSASLDGYKTSKPMPMALRTEFNCPTCFLRALRFKSQRSLKSRKICGLKCGVVNEQILDQSRAAEG